MTGCNNPVNITPQHDEGNMDEIMSILTNYGPLGVIAALLFFQMSKLQTKLLDIIETNTKAFLELKNVIDKCQVMHKIDTKE